MWCNVILLSNKKEQTIDILNNLDKSQENYTTWKKRKNFSKGLYTV